MIEIYALKGRYPGIAAFCYESALKIGSFEPASAQNKKRTPASKVAVTVGRL